MISRLWNKYVNRESITYIIFGVLTTLVDWLTYAALWSAGTDYRISTAVSWFTAVVFAFITNKFFVFQSYNIKPLFILKEFGSFVACRAATGVITMIGMIIMVSGLHLHEFIGKLVVSAMSLVLNYIFSKLVIFRKAGMNGESSDGT